MSPRRTRCNALVALVGSAAAACGGAGGGAAPGAFHLTGVSVRDGAIWQINRPIELVFDHPVDFTTVDRSTVQIQTDGGEPATGTFLQPDPQRVVFQPSCPLRSDLADAGLRPDGTSYVLTVFGRDSGAGRTVRSQDGRALSLTQRRRFQTPLSFEPSLAFLDTVVGGPRARLRSAGSARADATYLELGGDPEQRVYFERTEAGQLRTSVPGFRSPLNLYGDAESRVALVLEFDQPVNPSADNLSAERLLLELREEDGAWRPLESVIELLRNCTGGGAAVRLRPRGILPPGGVVRASVSASFEDLSGQPVFAPAEGVVSWAVDEPRLDSLVPADLLADTLVEGFDFTTLLDEEALFVTPRARWGGGRLAAAFDFDGDGGPGGAFDWHVPDNATVFFDTSSQTIVSADQTTQQNAVNGIVNVRNLIVGDGARLDVQGPNPLRIRATGDVVIRGTIDVNGANARDIVTLGTANQVEPGAPGTAGGGRGGNASEVITNSTPRGGSGDGPFRQPRTGGQGGETGYATGMKDFRRPGGGGGARFQEDEALPEAERAGPGVDGHPMSRGATTDTMPARGGLAGTGAFVDGDPTNNFLGLRAVVDEGGRVTELVRGELRRLWAGYGGGGGGDALPFGRFPAPNFNPNSDEKGGAGGGGAGALEIEALGRIVFGIDGQIRATGGRGGLGENTAGTDHVGGTGGSGSGGHVVLESATQIDFTDGGRTTATREWIVARGAIGRTGPLGNNAPAGISHGGKGGAGVIQLHVPDPVSPVGADERAAVRVPLLALGAEDPLDELTTPRAHVLIPTFGPRSRARSRWIPIGGADVRPDGPADPLRFRFEGTELAGAEPGTVRAAGEAVVELAPLVAAPLGSDVTVARDGLALEVRGAALAALQSPSPGAVGDDVYLRSPALLVGARLRLVALAEPQLLRDFTVVAARYDEGGEAPGDETLSLTTDLVGGAAPGDFQPPGGVRLELVPRFFRVVTDGRDGFLPGGSAVRILFEATGADARGLPDEANVLVGPTPDVSTFGELAPGALRFFRFEVDFRLVPEGRPLGADVRPVGLDFLKLPFTF